MIDRLAVLRLCAQIRVGAWAMLAGRALSRWASARLLLWSQRLTAVRARGGRRP